MRSKQLRDAIHAELNKIRIIDTHEHTESLEYALSFDNHLFRLLDRSFVQHDLIQMGTAAAKWKATVAGDEKGWRSLKPYIEKCRNTGYFRCFLIAVKDLFNLDIEELNDNNWEVVSSALSEGAARKDWYRYVLRERGNIDVVIWDRAPTEPDWHDIDRSLFIPTKRLDMFAWFPSPVNKRKLAEAYGSEPTTLADVIDLLDFAFQQAVNEGVCAIKIGAAYFRGLFFRESSWERAARVFGMSEEDVTYGEQVAYQDFIYSRIMELCVKYHLPMQIHTGMQTSPSFVHNGYPLYLEWAVSNFPQADFVLLHGGFPFTREAIALAAKYPNVYIEGSWLPILSPTAYRAAVSEWLDVLDARKILVWGGDCVRVEMTYGSLLIAKKIVADVLAEKVEEGFFSEIEALHTAKRIFRTNALRLFRTSEIRRRRMKAAEVKGDRAA